MVDRPVLLSVASGRPGQANPFAAALVAAKPPRPRRREFYRGDPPSGFTKAILDQVLVPGRAEAGQQPSTYWSDEVRDAQRIANAWAVTLLEGLSMEDVVAWISEVGTVRPEEAVLLQRAGVTPGELDWSYHDRHHGTLAERLLSRRWTVEQVVVEVEHRRTLT